MIKYQLLVCGGTFDLFHKGHKTFLKQTLALSEKVLIGITSNLYIQTFKNGLSIEDFKIRKKAVEQFIDSIGAGGRVEIVSINSAYEPYLESSNKYQAIAVTSQTEKTALDINLKRKKKQLPELKIIVIPMELTEDGREISSSRIRNGEINREGRLYINPKWKDKKLILPESLRLSLQGPWGEVFNDIPQDIDGFKTVVVGDATAQKFNEKKVSQFLSIVDFLIHREKKFHNLLELGFNDENAQKIKNPPGELTPELMRVVREAFDKRNQTVILIEGEEDLAVLPVLLVAPLGFSIFYGQPEQGMVRVNVNEENKEKAYKLLSDFDIT